jgi:hypothetical protein
VDLDTVTVRKEPGILFAEIAAPPMNLLGPELVRDLVSLIQQAETDDTIRVVVFKSADPDYFISHVDVMRISEYREATAKLTGEASLGLLFRYLSASRLVTIAQVEGRVRGDSSARQPRRTGGSIDRRNRVTDSQCGKLFAVSKEESIGHDDEPTCPQLDQGCKDRI